MAGPLADLLQRRPLRNAVRTLLGLQPRFGRGFGSPSRQVATSPAARPLAGAASANAQPSQPSGSFARVTTPVVEPNAERMPAAIVATVEPAANAMAVASGTDLDASPFRLPGREEIEAQRMRGYGAGDEEQRTRARSGLFANLPPITPVPTTTEIDPRQQKSFSAPQKSFSTNPPVGQNPPQANPEPKSGSRVITATPTSGIPNAAQGAATSLGAAPPAVPPAAVPPADSRLQQAAEYRAMARATRAQADGLFQQATRNEDTQMMWQNLHSAAEGYEIQAFQLERDAATERFAERKFAMDEKKNVPDTLMNDIGDFEEAVKRYGLSAAIRSALEREAVEVQLKTSQPPTPEREKLAALNFTVLGGGAMLANRIRSRDKPRRDDPALAELADWVIQAYPNLRDSRFRSGLVYQIVGSAQTATGGDPEAMRTIADLISQIVEERAAAR